MAGDFSMDFTNFGSVDNAAVVGGTNIAVSRAADGGKSFVDAVSGNLSPDGVGVQTSPSRGRS